MKKMTLRGKKFIRNASQIISITTLITALTILCTWAVTCELKDTHSTTVFKNVGIVFLILFIISCIFDYIAIKTDTKIRREVKAIKAKTWWMN